jgi:pyruvate/2-oxoglutarate dehydrogenase complex dihydrolipoamide acyltransferase (E2) component
VKEGHPLPFFAFLPAAADVAPLPAAAKMMAERSVAAAAIGAGTGKDGRITKGDVLDFLARPTAAPAPSAPAARAPRSAEAGEERVKMTRLRRTIAARLKVAQNLLLKAYVESHAPALLRLAGAFSVSGMLPKRPPAAFWKA